MHTLTKLNFDDVYFALCMLIKHPDLNQGAPKKE